MIIRPAKRLQGRVRMHGDKSISHRAALLAAISNGTSRITNYSTSADCAATLSCLQQLGVRIEQNRSEVIIHGAGLNGLTQPTANLDCANSGTTMRLLSGILAGQSFVSTLTGDDSLRSRPMQRIIEPLHMMGAQIESNEGRAPLQIHGTQPLRAIEYELLVVSAQVKSCILLAGLNASGKTIVIENEVTRDHTERMLRWFGVNIETGEPEREPEGARFASITGPRELQARSVAAPGDISSAAYFLAAAALLPDSSFTVCGVGLNPTRVAFLDQLRLMGFELTVSNEHEESNELRGDISVGAGRIKPAGVDRETQFRIDGAIVPQLIDELPLLAVVGSQLDSGIEIRDAKELRVKESDRIAATASGLRAMGAEVEEFDDGLRVAGPTKLRGAKIDSRGDHRIAMAFTVAGLVCEEETEIEDAACVAVSSPDFFDLVESVIER